MIIKIFYITIFVALCNSAEPDCTKRPPFGPREFQECCARPDFEQGLATQVKDKCSQYNPGENNMPMFGNPCFKDCVLNESKIMENGEFNQANVKAALSVAIPDAEFRQVISTAFETCPAKAKTRMAQFQGKMPPPPPMPPRAPGNAALNCMPNFYVGMTMGCVMFESFKNCPDSKWSTSATCKDIREYLKACGDNMMGPGGPPGPGGSGGPGGPPGPPGPPGSPPASG